MTNGLSRAGCCLYLAQLPSTLSQLRLLAPRAYSDHQRIVLSDHSCEALEEEPSVTPSLVRAAPAASAVSNWLCGSL